MPRLIIKYYFTPEREPCQARYRFEKELDNEGFRKLNASSFEDYIKKLEKHDKFEDLLKYEPIRIVEKES